MEKTTSIKNCFRDGAIDAQFIGDAIAKHQAKTNIGAHQIFLGQVRADIINDQGVVAIDYSAHQEIANAVFHDIRESAFQQFELTCMHIYHSLGIVETGKICLFVFVSSPHRKAAFEALEYIVERIKKEAPIFGKEILENDTHVWKVNK